MEEYKIIDEVYAKRHTLQKRRFWHEYRQKQIYKRNTVLKALEIALFVLLLFFFVFMLVYGVAFPLILTEIIIFLAVFVCAPKILRLEKSEAREAVEAQLFFQAMIRIDKQISYYKVMKASPEEQIKGMEVFEILEQSDQIPVVEWNRIGELFEEEKRRHRSDHNEQLV